MTLDIQIRDLRLKVFKGLNKLIGFQHGIKGARIQPGESPLWKFYRRYPQEC